MLPAAPRLSQDEVVYRRYLDFGSLVRGGRVVPNWLPDGSSFWYVQGEPNEREVVKVDPATNAATPLFDVRRLRSAFREAFGSEPAGAGVPFETFQFLEPNQVRFLLNNMSYQLDLEHYTFARSKADRAVPGTFMRERFVGGEHPSPESLSPDGLWIAGIEEKNLVLRATGDGQKVRVTDDGTSLAFWDVEAELWNPWSPDNSHLAVFKHNTEGLSRVPTLEWLKPRAQIREVILIPAGGALYRSELYLIDLSSKRPLPVDLGDTTSQYLRILSWLPDGSELILARYNRVFSRVDIQSVNVRSRAVRTVVTEQSETFLTNHHEAIWGTDTGFTLLPDGSGFIWNSEQSGWDHLYHYDMRGQLVRQLTSGKWRVKDVVRVDQVGGWVYFTGHGDTKRQYDVHLYRVRLDGAEPRQLTEGKGRHEVHISPSARYFIDTYSAVDVPPRTVVRKTDGTLVSTLSEADIDDLRAIGWVPPQEYVVKADDDVTNLWVTAYFPYNFDLEKKYPVVEHIYAGPQRAERPMEFGDKPESPWSSSRQQNFKRALANLGFVVLTLDARGTPQRSKSFHDTVYRNWGQFEIADHASAIRQLGERLAFLDLDRVGVLGASWGGQFAFRAMTQASDLYKVGICEVPGLDPRRLMILETYLGMPQENGREYDAASPFALAPKLKGELLLIGGLNDTPTQADLFKLSDILIRLGKQHRTMNYPDSGHVPAGETAEYDMEMKKQFFVEHLITTVGDR